MNRKNQILVAMSGGVDSSVAAAILVEEKFNVIGIMLNLWSDPTCNKSNACCTPFAQQFAKSVANKLGIPFYVIDAKDVFYQEVVQNYISNVKLGITPNPCWVCNMKVKWEVLHKQLQYFDADYLATGHYARLIMDKTQVFHLQTATDKLKDQSYVLSGLNQQQLKHTLFPLGTFTKSEVRKKASQFGLSTAKQQDSQDLCFLGTQTPEKFILNFQHEKERGGEIIDSSGKILGYHNGLIKYTIGQRKGINISSSEPYYVIKKDVLNNKLVIGYRSDLGGNKIIVSNVNWISCHKPKLPLEIELQIRYHARKVKSILEDGVDDHFSITSSEMLRDITPGQIAVFYDGDEVIGSGIMQ